MMLVKRAHSRALQDIEKNIPHYRGGGEPIEHMNETDDEMAREAPLSPSLDETDNDGTHDMPASVVPALPNFIIRIGAWGMMRSL